MTPEGDHTTEELSEIVRELSDRDLLKLRAAARTLMAKCNRPPDEIVNEATRRALDGRRVCPKRMSVVAFLFGAMRSVAWEWAQGIAAERGLEEERIWGFPEAIEIEGVGDPRPDPEMALLDSERLRREQAVVDEVKKMFEDDEQGWFVLEARLEGKMTPDEVSHLLGY